MNAQLKQQIILAFEKTLLPSKASIEEGSALLTQLKTYQGCCLMFMQIVDDETTRDEIRQAAAIQLKLTVEKRWKSKKTPPLSENEKNTIRQFLLTAFLRSHRNTKILPIYKVIVKMIIEFDFKEWIPLNDAILQIQKDPTTIPGCLYFIEAIFNGTSKLIEEERVYIENMIELIFPHLYEILKTNQSLEIVYLVSKIIWRGYKNMIKQKAMTECFKFMDILKNIIEYYDTNLASLHNIKLQKHTQQFYYFHSKKWACRTLWRFFQSHANSVFHETNVEFSKKWYGQFGKSFVECLIKQIPIPSIQKAKFFQFKSLVSVTSFKYQLIEAYSNELLFKQIIPFILLTPKQEETAKEDPLEYLRGEEDPVQDNTNVKFVATDLWIDLAGKNPPQKGKKKEPSGLPKYLVPAMEFLKEKLEQGDMISKEMAMYLLCKMHRVLENIEQIKSAMPTLIKAYVLPHFNNQIMLLRARAAQLFSEYGHIDFPDESILKQAVEGIYVMMTTDSNPVVKLKAAYAFNCILRHNQAIAMVKPYLKQILSSYIQLLNNYETESLVNSLEGIVAHFSDQIGIFALDLVKHLNNLFGRYCGIVQVQNNENALIDVELAAGGCIQTIKRIVDSPLTNEVLKQIEPYIASIIQLGFTKQGNDYTNDMLYLLSSYISKASTISKEMWFFYPCLFYLVTGTTQPVPNAQHFTPVQQKIFENFSQNPNSELFVDALPAIRSYVYKGIDVLTTQNDFFGTNLFMLIFKTADKLYEGSPEDDVKATITALMTYILENMKQSSEQLVIMMWQIIKRNMMENSFKYLRIMNSQLACMCMYISPAKFFELVELENSIDLLFDYIFHPDSLYLNEWEKQRIVLGLSKVLTINNRSQKLTALIPRIMDTLKKHIIDIGEIRDDKQNEENKAEDKEDDEFGLDGDDDLDDIYWEEPRDDDFKTALDEVDEVGYYEQAIKIFREQEPELYNQMMARYSQEDLQGLNEAIVKSKEEFVKRRVDIIRNIAEMTSKGIAY